MVITASDIAGVPKGLRGVKCWRPGVHLERERAGARFVRAWVQLSFADDALLSWAERTTEIHNQIVHELYGPTGGRTRSQGLALMGYAASLFSTCGLSRSELHRAFLEIGWAQLDERDWWRDSRQATATLRDELIDRGGNPPVVPTGTPRPSSQRIRCSGTLVMEPFASDRVRAEKPFADPALRSDARRIAEERAEARATAQAVSRLSSLAEPPWVADLFRLSATCRRVAVEAEVVRLQSRHDRIAARAVAAVQ